MNAPLSNWSSQLCKEEPGSTPVLLLETRATIVDSTTMQTPMKSYKARKRLQKRIMLLMALCLAFATAVPVMVLAAG